VQLIRDFFVEIDSQWPRESNKVRLSIIGSGALMLQTNYARGTKDSDVFETAELTGGIQRTLLAIAGAGTVLHRRRRMYVDIVASGVPFLPHVPVWRPARGLTEALQCLEVFALDITDVVVSKLKRFIASDQEDIDEMIQRGFVPHERLLERFRAAVDEFSGDARAEELPKYVANLHRVERDMIGVAESEIALPSWI
jgi:hypothetical protein